ncbi:hypothetical protein [Streptomyces otsuchiensis]|uniref:hypothetical protein n=1 Tax=Streptomyces otsuchiensis TaxID=2681388 RepID=UPI001031532F|nr:hypothetical protein [Streptomyces otsuchiensis]
MSAAARLLTLATGAALFGAAFLAYAFVSGPSDWVIPAVIGAGAQLGSALAVHGVLRGPKR